MSAPVTVIQDLVADFQAGRRDSAGFLSGLEVVDNFLVEWAAGIDGLSVPPNYLEGLELQEAAQQALDRLARGVAELRYYAESLDEESLANGLGWSQEGQDLLVELIQITEANVARLEDDM